jgi:predicted RNase H-like HicB family nuclease
VRLESQALDLVPQLPDLTGKEIIMKIRIVVHDAEEGGYWAEVPAIPGCASQGETMDELMVNLREAIEGCLSVEVEAPAPGGDVRMLELTA